MKRACYILAVLACLMAAGCSRDPKAMRDRCMISADKYFQRGKFKEASILYRRALQLDPKDSEAYYRLGKVQIALGQYFDASRSLERASNLDPANEDAAVQLAQIYIAAYASNPQFNKHALEEARPLIAQIIKRNPNSFGGLRLEADLAVINNDLQAAILKLQQADQVKAWQPEVIIALMQDLAASGRQPEAEKLGEEFLARDKTVPGVYDLLFQFYRQSSRFDRAEGILKTRIANLPQDATARLALAAFYYSRNRKPEMLALLQGLRVDPKAFPHPDILVGDFYARAGESDFAIQTYREGEKHEPKLSIDYEKRITNVLITQGREKEALAIVSGLQKKAPQDSEIAAVHASLMATGGPQEVQSAIAELESLIQKQTGNAMLHFYLARAYWIRGDPGGLDKAQQHFETSLKLNPGYLPAELGLARVRLARGESGMAVQAAQEILESSPGNLPAMLTRAAGLVNLGEREKAREQLVSALNVSRDSADARYQLAALDLDEKRYREAEAGFQALAQSGDARGPLGLADSKKAQGQPAAAVQILEQELGKHPERDAYRLALADLETQLGRLKDARSQLEELARKNPSNATVFMRLGTLQHRLQDKAGALENFRTAHRLQPANATVAVGYAMLLEDAGQTEQARTVYEELIKTDPDNPTALNNLAYIKADQGVDLDQALAYAQRALQLSPKDPNIFDTLGLIYIRKKLSNQAVQVLRDLVARVPDNPSFHLHLAMALYDTGDKRLAKKELERALESKPSAAEQDRIKEFAARIG